MKPLEEGLPPSAAWTLTIAGAGALDGDDPRAEERGARLAGDVDRIERAAGRRPDVRASRDHFGAAVARVRVSVDEVRPVRGDVEAEGIDVLGPAARGVSGPSTVEVPSGSQILNLERFDIVPGMLRTATIRPPSDCAMSIQFSVSPSPFTTGVARRAFFAPSSDASQTSPLSTYATDAASAIAGVTTAAPRRRAARPGRRAWLPARQTRLEGRGAFRVLSLTVLVRPACARDATRAPGGHLSAAGLLRLPRAGPGRRPG